jgi:DNA-binding NtrC family response regulator
MYVFEGREETVLSYLFMTEAAQGGITGVSPSAIVGVENLGETGTADDAALLGAEPAVPLLNLGELRRLAVRQAMRLTNGHRGRAAELLGVSLNTMTRLVAESCPEVPANAAAGQE